MKKQYRILEKADDEGNGTLYLQKKGLLKFWKTIMKRSYDTSGGRESYLKFLQSELEVLKRTKKKLSKKVIQ